MPKQLLVVVLLFGVRMCLARAKGIDIQEEDIANESRSSYMGDVRFGDVVS